MIVLDTNVVSEPLKPRPERAVIEWLNRQDPNILYLASTSLAELLLAVEILPDGRRKDTFQAALTGLLLRFFGSRILSFDEKTATNFAPLVAKARGDGKAISMADDQIAAIAATNGFIVASRHTTPFLAARLRRSIPGLLINRCVNQPQFRSRYPVLNIHDSVARQTSRKKTTMPRLMAGLTSAIP